jgi:NAD(P)-dependent dehydrogenase (short-subunit alcohol dehydrogenase family)
MLETYNTNVFGGIQTLETFSPLLAKSTVPRVVFVTSSLGSFSRGNRETGGKFAVYRSSKSALNMMVLSLSRQERFKGWKINLTCPGHVATNLNAHTAKGTAESGAINAVRLATLGEDGETGTLSDRNGPFEW